MRQMRAEKRAGREKERE